MTNLEERWKERHRMLEDRTGRFRVDSCRIIRAENGYRVECFGIGMVPAISPPKITVGGLPVREVRYLDQGRRIEAVISAAPKDGTVVLDFVHGTATLKAVRE